MGRRRSGRKRQGYRSIQPILNAPAGPGNTDQHHERRELSVQSQLRWYAYTAEGYPGDGIDGTFLSQGTPLLTTYRRIHCHLIKIPDQHPTTIAMYLSGLGHAAFGPPS